MSFRPHPLVILQAALLLVAIGLVLLLFWWIRPPAEDVAPPPPPEVIVPAAGRFVLPVGCTLGQDCWILNYPDRDPAPGQAQDYRCRPRSYDTHKGTDIAVATMADLSRAVAVLAPADGAVLRLRDGVDDNLADSEDIARLRAAQMECGNGLVIDHGDGWESQLCHLRRGSIVVQPGQRVQAGEVLGQIGSSGMSQHPHLDIGFRLNGEPIDPATGAPLTAACDPNASAAESLWLDPALAVYHPGAIIAVGPTTGSVDYDALLAGTLPPMPQAGDETLVVWALVLATATGDQLMLEAKLPGSSWTQINTHTVTRAQQRALLGTVGQLSQGLPPGPLQVRARLMRAGELISERTSDIVPILPHD